MRFIRAYIIILCISLLLAGCHRENKPEETRPLDTEPTASYDWMAGESPVPVKRIGVHRIGNHSYQTAVSPNGVYFISDSPLLEPYIWYADNGSDQIIPLCGRADCTHDNADCNAYLPNAAKITFYRGRLYAAVCSEVDYLNEDYEAQIIRMEPDGTNRVIALDLSDFVTKHGGDFIDYQMFTDGYLFFSVMKWIEEEQGDGNMALDSQSVATYYCSLDNLESEPVVLLENTWLNYHCGNVIMSYAPTEAQNGGAFGGIYEWDLESNTKTYLTDHPGTFGYFDREAGYYFLDGAFYRLDYATQKTEILFQTDLEGKYYAYLYPDCIVIAEADRNNISDNCLYIYNWAYELVEKIDLEFEHEGTSTINTIVAETAERFLLIDDPVNNQPLYYIEKSELGTGNAVVHEFQRN